MGTTYNDMVIGSGGTRTTLTLYGYDVASRTKITSSGSMYVSSGGTAGSTTVSSGGSLTVYSRGMVSSTTVSSGGSMIVSSGGTASSTTVSGGSMVIRSSGLASSTTVSNGGRMILSSGGTASSTTVSYGGRMILSSGGTESSTVISRGGSMLISSGGTASRTTVEGSGACIGIFSSGTVNSALVSSGGSVKVSSGGKADHTSVYSSGLMYVFSSGFADSTTVSGGSMEVSSGGKADHTSVYSSGLMYVFSSGFADSTTVSGGSMEVSSGGKAENTEIFSGGSLILSSGGRANGTIVFSSGSMVFSGQGTADNTSVSSGGSMILSSGGTAYRTSVYSSGLMYVFSSGFADSTTVSRGGSMILSSGGTASHTEVLSCGTMIVCSGGTANSTTVSSGGIYIFNGGIASNVSVLQGGCMTVSNGGIAAGSLKIENGANVTFDAGGELHMDLLGRSSAGRAMLDDYSRISGTPAVTLKVSLNELARKESVSYALADNAASFGGQTTIKTADNEVLGTRAVDSVLETDHFDYLVTRNDGTLMLTVTNKAEAPLTAPSGFDEHDTTAAMKFNWTGAAGNTYRFRYGITAELTGIGESSETSEFVLDPSDLNVGQTYCYQVCSVDSFGLQSDWSLVQYFSVHKILNDPETTIDAQGNIQTGWTASAPGASYVAQYTDTAANKMVQVDVTSNKVNVIGLDGLFAWHAAESGSERWTENQNFEAAAADVPVKYTSPDSDADDVFFARSSGLFSGLYSAHNMLTGEYMSISGMNQFTDMFAGGETNFSTLFLTDAGGDAFFVDDIYSESAEYGARIDNLNRIYAGAGDDLIDLTSIRFAEESNSAICVHGGNDDDTIWGGNSDGSMLFGDLGNDVIKGGTGNDFIIGGAGNDDLYGNGGDDMFIFGAENWGTDTVTQTDGGTVRLWFADGRESNWDPLTMTYTDGDNSVRVDGVSAGQVTLKFGADPDFAVQLEAGVLDETRDQKIYTTVE